MKVPCVGGQNDGLDQLLGIFDEIHEMTGNKEKAHLGSRMVKKKNKHNWNKHNDSWVENSLAYRLYKYAKNIEDGEIEDEGFYFKIYEVIKNWIFRS